MRDRSEQILRLACLALAALLLAQLVRVGFRVNPLAGVKIPPVPVLETNSAAATHAPAAPPANVHPPGTVKPEAAVTNISTNQSGPANSIQVQTVRVTATNLLATNLTAKDGTNLVPESGTIATAKHTKKPGRNPPPGMNFGAFPMMPGMGGPAPNLPAEIQARVDKIVNSEIFAPVMHPLPMGLMGIAGDTAFLRTDSGQTGLVKVGDTLGDLKLLRIGVNRVLVEQAGQKKELMIFDGYGGESLLQTDTPNENAHP